MEEELAIVRAYLDIESLRLGDRLKVEETIDPRLLKALMPPFSFQPLVENAIHHGLHSSPGAGRIQLTVRPTGQSSGMTGQAYSRRKSNMFSSQSANESTR